jgi:anthranilate synthase/aminodeoxychorismate synthase-like glutamine amidotransferase
MTVVIIDHKDSFTHILRQYFGEVAGEIPVILQHDQTSIEEIRALKPSHIVLSPGPGSPEKLTDFSIGLEILQEFAGRIPILGVCLGHQGIAMLHGSKIVHAPEVMHGKRSEVSHSNNGIFSGLPNPMTIMRYHSLMIDPESFPQELEITARTKDGLIMGFQHKKLPIHGVQFHPESVGTEHGLQLIQNFYGLT